MHRRLVWELFGKCVCALLLIISSKQTNRTRERWQNLPDDICLSPDAKQTYAAIFSRRNLFLRYTPKIACNFQIHRLIREREYKKNTKSIAKSLHRVILSV